jgi:transposase
MKQDTANQKSEAPAKEIIKIKFGLDVHATQITVCRQIGDRTPQPPLKMKWDQALKFIKDSGGPDIELHSCYEAGPFGYHLHRTLQEMGVKNFVVTPERLDPRCKRVKTDKRDARTLAMRLDSYTKGNTAAFSIVTVPTPQQEMDRLVSRQRWSRSKEKQRCLKRARSLMLTHGITAPDEWWDNDSWKILQKHLPAPLASQVGYWRGIGLEIQKGHDTLSEELRKAGERRRRPKGFGALSMEELSREILDWNRFKNRREVSSYTGLCPSEYSSGQSRSQGSVTKHGNPRVRHILVEGIWRLLRWQPNYKPVQAVQAAASKSARKKCAVAAARQLAVDLWRISTGQCTGEQLGLITVEGLED